MDPAPPATSIHAAPVPRRRRWRRYVLLLSAAGGLALILFLGHARFAMERAWKEAEEEAAQDLARWRLLELEADRPPGNVADEESAALHVAKIMPAAVRFWWPANYSEIFDKLPPEAQLNVQQIQLLRSQL